MNARRFSGKITSSSLSNRWSFAMYPERHLIVLRNLLLGALILTSFAWIDLLLNLLLPVQKDGQARSNYASHIHHSLPPTIYHTHSPAFSNVGQPGSSTWSVSGGISGASGARGR
jgi:hypothetical protein